MMDGRPLALWSEGKLKGASMSASFQLSIVSALFLIHLLLVGIETNPGPFPCHMCPVVPETISSSIRHQQVHASCKNFLFYCPSESCFYFTKSWSGLKYHVSMFHRTSHHQDPSNQSTITCSHSSSDGGECPYSTASLWELVQHLYQHLIKSETIHCPIKGCRFSHGFQKKSTFQVHLSQYHKNWRSEGCPKEQLRLSETQPVSSVPISCEDDIPMDIGSENTSESYSDCMKKGDLRNDGLIFENIAKFYLHLYAQKLLPYSVIQEIGDGLSYLSELNQARQQVVMSNELRKLGLPEEHINVLMHKMKIADVLFVSHQKNLPGPSMSSNYRRMEYFKKTFDFIKPIEVNLNEKDPKLQYISITETLNILFQDPSVQKEIEASFLILPSYSNEVRDYYDGTQFLSEDHPVKEVRLFLYQDAYNGVLNPLGSAKNNFKTLAVYFSIANFTSHLRSRVDTKHLALLVRESIFKEVGAKKCFERLLQELVDLETHGIMFKGERVQVGVLDILGDNLGQHTIGGFIECFSAKYFCRFCEITKGEFKQNPHITKPQRSVTDYNKCVLKARLLEKHSKGIKFGCEFNRLKYIHATSHLAPCLAHDLFEGVLSWDLAAIIYKMVYVKKYFTYKLLNCRIKGFRCKGFDSGNKLAYVPNSGKKLGGHAIQNWTMLRVLPFLIGDRIRDFQCPEWQLYLKLKDLCEYLCGPSFDKTDIPYMKDVLLPQYFSQRSMVLTDRKKYPLRPKHHFLAHYPELMIKYGPLLYLWTMAYEQKHNFFKTVMRMSRNFINPEYTCAVRHQLNFSFQSTKEMFQEGCGLIRSETLSVNNFSGELATFIATLNLQSWQCASEAFFNELTYKIDDIVLLPSEGSSVLCGVVKVITMQKNGPLHFVVEVQCAEFNQHLGIYQLPPDAAGEFQFMSAS